MPDDSLVIAQRKLEQLRDDVRFNHKRLRITTHAQEEAAKDGLFLKELRQAFENGRLLEYYPEQDRFLLLAEIAEISTPFHVVVESTREAGVIVTTYVPDKRRWMPFSRRRPNS